MQATDRPLNRWLPVLGVAVVLGVGAVAAALSSPEVTNVPMPDQGTPGATPSDIATTEIDIFSEPPPTDAGGSYGLPSWVTYAGVVVCAVLVAGIVGTLVYYLLRNRAPKHKPRLFVEDEAPKPMPAAAGEEVLAAVEAGLVELTDTDADPRKAVIACWVRLERAAAAAGTPRLPGDSPTELVTRLLSAHQVSRPTLEGFAEVYREARYATHPVGERSRHDAVAALRQIRAELSGVGRATPGGARGGA